MTFGEFRELTKDIQDGDELLLFPGELEGTDEEGNDILEEPGIGAYSNGELLYIGPIQCIQEVEYGDVEE